MIISASRRTDIPALYAEWFERRIRKGSVCVRNPLNAHQVSRVSLSPDVVDCIVFWTKNPRPMLGRLDCLRDYLYYFQFTLTGYGRDVEPHVPNKREGLISTFRELSERIGPQRVIWRYDPIMFNGKYTLEYHLRAFESIAGALEGATERCVISFVDIYARNRGRMGELGLVELPEDELRAFARELTSMASAHGMEVESCAETIDLADCGVRHGSCIDAVLIERLAGAGIKVKKDPSQRAACGCVASVDIGSYDTCRNGCVYCYATRSGRAVASACARYDVDSPLLCDALREDDVVRDRKMVSLLERQLGLGI